jgi:hypothetical protein
MSRMTQTAPIQIASNGTLRVIGIAIAAGGRAVDIALVETDGTSRIRHRESERSPLGSGPTEAATIDAVRRFMGDRTLQPFAVDLLALAGTVQGVTVAGIAAGCEVTTVLAAPGSGRGATRAEQSAFAAVAAFLNGSRGGDLPHGG